MGVVKNTLYITDYRFTGLPITDFPITDNVWFKSAVNHPPPPGGSGNFTPNLLPAPGISHVRRSDPGNFHTFPLTALDPGNFHQRLIRDFTDNSAPTYQ